MGVGIKWYCGLSLGGWDRVDGWVWGVKWNAEAGISGGERRIGLGINIGRIMRGVRGRSGG